jgi:hypothetical protein
MPSLKDHHRSTSTKMLLIGDSGSGKTGALAALAADGYNLRILDFDNGLSALVEYLTTPSSLYVAGKPPFKPVPDAVGRVHYSTCTDEMKQANGRIWAKKAEAWAKALKLLDNWEEDGVKFGPLSSWGPKDILVIDTLTKMCDVAMNHHLQMNAALGTVRTQNEWRRDIGAVQQMVRDVLQLLFDKNVACNVIINSHITMVNDQGVAPGADGTSSSATGYPSAVGRALSPHIPRWFDSVLIAKATGSGTAVRRQIFTGPQNVAGQIVNAKNAAPLSVKPTYGLELGLAEYFRAVRGEAPIGASI